MLVSETSNIPKHMNLKTRILTLTTCLITLAVPTPLLAAKGDKKGIRPNKVDQAGRAARPGVLLKKYDGDKSGAIDGTEIEALRKAFDAAKTGPLKKLDANTDGTLDDSEVAAIKAHGKGKGKGEAQAGRAAKRKKKNA